MSNNNISIQIEGNGISIKKDISQGDFVKIMSILFTESDTGKKNAEMSLNSTSQDNTENGRPISVSEFMNNLNVKTHPRKIAAIALYHEKELDKPMITKNIIPEWYKKAGLSAPKNIPRDIRNAIKKDLIAEDHKESDKYYITNTGKDKLSSS